MFRRSRLALTVSLVAVLVATLLNGVPARLWPGSPQRPAPPAERIDADGGAVTAGRAWAQNRVADTPAANPAWPDAVSATLELGLSAVRVGSSPVRVAGRGRITVRLLDRGALPEQWRNGLLLSLSGPATVSVEYTGFRSAVGGDWSSRLRLWRVPACALSTPDDPACWSVPLPSTNDPAAGVVTSTGPVTATDAYVMLAAAQSGSGGDFTATPLAATGTWASGGSSGDFTWSYPLRVPPATGPRPEVTLAYSAQAVDGRSDVTNNQPSVIGEGFDYSPGFIERSYIACLDDMGDGANNTRQTTDLCWKSDNATISAGGHAGELVYEAGTGWHLRNEDGSRVERFTGAGNGDNDGEYWKMTTTDGTQYFFGRSASSTLTVPVYGNHGSEPCHATGYAASYCAQAWRWQLDSVVDVRGNTMSYSYGKDTNKYARNITDADDTAYDRDAYVTRIDYGTYDRTLDPHGVTERSTGPSAQVVFDYGPRCVADCGTEAAPVKANWKDTPWDQECKVSATSCPQQYSPTFWSTKRLATVTTRVWDTTKATPAWQDVDRWTLTHTFSATADSTHTGLWLDRIDHSGLVGGEVAMPPVTFGAVSLPNRVLTANGTANNWLRISDIVTETGGRIHVDYSAPDCTANDLPIPQTNTRRCYPVLVPDPLDPELKRLKTEWWQKYRVEHVTQDDVRLGGKQARSVHTWYEYAGAPAWHYTDDDGVTPSERRTWSQWRGYATVKTRVGDNPAGPTTLTVTNFLRGMHGDRAAPVGGTRTVTVAASLGTETVYDEDQFAGQAREEIVYDGAETRPVSKTVTVPWRSDPTAARGAGTDRVEARFARTRVQYSATALGPDGARGWRVTRTVTEHDTVFGSVTSSQEDGDVAVTGDERCTTTEYNRNTGKNLTQVVRRTTVTALPCSQAPTSADDVISDDRYTYDGATGPDAPPRFGAVTRSEELKDWAAGAGTVWRTAGQSSFRPDGRAATTTDLKGNVTTTEYTPAVGGPVTAVATTGPMPGWTSRQELSPYWGTAVKSVDPNDRITAEVAYDPLGRIAKVWRLGWPRAGHENQPSAEYTYVLAPNRDAYPYVVTRALNADGNAVTSYQILDGLLRPRQTQAPSAAGDGNRVVTDTISDEYGRVATTYGAHVEPGTGAGILWAEPEWSVPAVSRTVFDLAGRTTAEVFLSGDGRQNLVERWRTTIGNEGDRVTATPPAGGVATTTVTDAEGRTVALRQHTTAAGVAGAYQETRYEYDRKGHQTKVVDPAGSEWTTRYDILGREKERTDPDKGAVANTYNDTDEVVSTRDARGEVLWYTYDRIGRRTEVRDDSTTGPLRAQWKYDALYSGQPGFRGRLTESIRYEPAGSATAYKWQVRQFDARYQPAGVNYVIPAAEGRLAGTYVYSYGFSASTGEPVTATYPGGPMGSDLTAEQLSTDYHDTTGLPVRLDTGLTGSAGTLATASYTAYGEVNGTVRGVPGGTAFEDAIHRDEATRRITRMTAPGADRTYAYDPAGNITGIAEPADQQCFRYDRLAQLTSAWTPRPGLGCDAGPTVADLGGAAPYWQDWTFNAAGSRTGEVSHAADGDTIRTYTLSGGGTGPHAVTAMTTTAPGRAAVVNRYTYDRSGNTVCRPAAAAANDCATGTGSQTLTWTPDGHLAIVDAGGVAEHGAVYDADGVRLVRRDLTGTTIFLPGQELRQEGSTVTGTRYYTFAGGVIASRRGGSAPANLTWTYLDHQGTQLAAVNAAGGAAMVRRQTPYGAPRGDDLAWPNPKGFVGGDEDPSGLLQLGARPYDPATGRFLSDDPVFASGKPQQFDGYGYGGNNPLTQADPTGLCYKPCFDDEWSGPNTAQHMDRGKGERRKQNQRDRTGGPDGGPICTLYNTRGCKYVDMTPDYCRYRIGGCSGKDPFVFTWSLPPQRRAPYSDEEQRRCAEGKRSDSCRGVDASRPVQCVEWLKCHDDPPAGPSPDGSKAAQQTADDIAAAANHSYAEVSACFIICVTVTENAGGITLYAGSLGTPGVTGTVGFTSATPDEMKANADTFGACAAYGVGACYTGGERTGSTAENPSYYHGGGVTVGVGGKFSEGGSAGQNKTVWSGKTCHALVLCLMKMAS